MKFLIFVLFFACFAALDAGECNSYEREKINEGYHKCVYKVAKKDLIIGVGYNLSKSGAENDIKAIGADYNKVLNGTECLNDSQIQKLFNKDMDIAVSCASSWLSNWESVGSGPQSAVADMAFSMGCDALHKLVNLQSALERKDYWAAIDAIKTSTWCTRVGYQCNHDVACLE